MILILLLEVRNIKNMTKFTIKMAAILVIVIIMKTIAATKAVMIIKLIVLRLH